MTLMQTDRLVDDYLSRLEKAAAHLQRSRRTELIAEIREHIEAALREEDASSEVAVRNVLERLGPPEEIVEAAEPEEAARPAARTGRLEVATVVAVAVPFVGWIPGLVMLFLSRAWSSREKAIGVVLVLFPLLLPLLGLASSADGTSESVPMPQDPTVDTTSDSDGGVFEVLLFAFLLGAGLPASLYLAWRLRRERAVT